MKTTSLFMIIVLTLISSIIYSQTIDLSQSQNNIHRIPQKDGSLLEIKTLLNWKNNQWENSWRNIYSYDTENKLIEELDQGWNKNMWNDVFQGYYYYDTNNNLIEFLVQSSVGINFLRYLYSYDVNNNRIESIRQRWNVNVWENGGRVLYTYSINNDITEEIVQEWNGSAWINVDKYTYSYIVTEIENVEESVLSYGISNNFPNPFNPSTRIKYFIPTQSYVTIKVFDALGNEIATLVNEEKQTGNYSVEFDASELTSGIYFYRLRAGDYIETRKMMFIK
jgi:hypothetical protein